MQIDLDEDAADAEHLITPEGAAARGDGATVTLRRTTSRNPEPTPHGRRGTCSSRAGPEPYELFVLALSVLSLVNLFLALPFMPLGDNQRTTIFIIYGALSVVTMTTVGYGDQFPVTAGGRVVGFFVLAVGVGLFATFTGFLANAFLSPPKEKTPEVAEGAAALIGEIRRELAQQEQRSASLRSRLDELEASLSG